MAHEQAAPREPVVTEAKIANLAMHLLDRLAGACRIVFRLEVTPRRFVGKELEVGHVDVDQPIHEFE